MRSKMFTAFNFNSETLISISLGLVVLILLKYALRRKNLPPGPLGLPIVGYLPFLAKDPRLQFHHFTQKYGKVFSFQLGSQLAVVLNEGPTIREAFSQPELLGRPQMPAMVLSKSDTPFFSDQISWREHRRFILKSLRDLGLGKSKMHEHVQEEIRHLVQRIREEKGEPFYVKTLLTPSMSNNICSLVFGKRCDYEDPERLFMDEAVQETSEKMEQTTGLLFFPWILAILAKLMRYMRSPFPKMNQMQMIIRQKIKEHAESFDDNDLRDFIDLYLVELKNRRKRNLKSTFSELKLAGSAQTLFGAGSETVRTTVDWCFSIFAAYPEVQEKIRKELHDIIGDQRLPNFSDYKYTPYTVAVIQEIMRWKTMVPINILRKTLDDTEISGYCIPKGSIVIANFEAAHHDPKVWHHPHDFVPERFLSPDRKTVIKDDNFMPFSYGKRACPGEGLATLEVYLYITSILQHFHISVPDGSKLDLEGSLGLTYQINPQKLVFMPRK